VVQYRNGTESKENARGGRSSSGAKRSGTWKLDTTGFCTTWKQAETNCYAIIPSGKSKMGGSKRVDHNCGVAQIAMWL
jgi:hypothetical protein